jgi:hypothetical protein
MVAVSARVTAFLDEYEELSWVDRIEIDIALVAHYRTNDRRRLAERLAASVLFSAGARGQ